MISIESSDNVLHSIEEHHDIIEAIKKKDARLSGKAMGLHISNVKNRIKNLFKFDEKYDE
jgi:DNA-binding GntR family transcriptional regulator